VVWNGSRELEEEARKVLAENDSGSYGISANNWCRVLARNGSWSRKKSANNLLKLVSID